MPGVEKRSRKIIFRDNLAARSYVTYPTGGIASNYQNSNRYIAGTQVTESEGHLFPSKRKEFKDAGGPFRTVKNRFLVDGQNRAPKSYGISHTDSYGNTWYYTGPIFPRPTIGASDHDIFLNAYPPTLESSDEFLKSLGTTAIARCKPTNSIANLSVALAETASEGIPKFVGAASWKSRAKGLRELSRGVSDDYLTYQFGWMPLISDVSSTIRAAQDANRILEQFRRDDGKLVRRRYQFPSTTETTDLGKTTYSGYGIAPTGIPNLNLAAGGKSNMTFDCYKTRTVERSQWFSGAFTYHMPIADTTLGRIARNMAEVRKLYGLSIDPEVIWNVLPWSWAVDWAVNIGDLLANASDAMTDGLVMPYGYMMEHTIVTDTWEAELPIPQVGRTSISLITETKKRVQASPYGFGLTWDGFSPYQLSIMAALGISRR